jgi:hypothetical protein
MRPFFVLLFAVFAFAARAASPSVISRWVQMGPGGLAEARAITRSSTCPAASFDGVAVAMQPRAAPDAKFSVLVCSVSLPATLQHLTVGGDPLPVPKSAPRRILVIGDTGCRIKGIFIQNCNDPAAWPFPRAAVEASKLKPDLIIHVGDYLYRETACPDGDGRCTGSPSGDSWPAWAADFFVPGKPLLEAAPWVIVRGNHEDCERAGAGFIRLLGPLAWHAGQPCIDHLAPYTVPIGGSDLIVMDNASAPDRAPSADLEKTYRADFAMLPRLANRPSWLVMHHPIWGVVTLGLGFVTGGNSTLMDAEDATALPPAIDLMLAGHIHAFEAINYGGGLPPQLIVGEGGDLLDDAPADLGGQSIGNAKVANGLSIPGFGYILLTKNGEDWRAEVFDASGARERSCDVAHRRIVCAKA